MKLKILIKFIITSFFLISCESTVNLEDLEEKNKIYYKKRSNIPYSGKIDGISFGIYTKGQMKDGKAQGEWFFYHNNGNLDRVGKFINGKQNGKWYFYDNNAKHLKTEVFDEGKLIETINK